MKKKKKGVIISAILVVLSAAANLGLLIQKDNVIIYQELSTYRTWRTVSLAALAATVLLMLISLIASGKKGEKKEKTLSSGEIQHTLSVKEKLSNSSLRQILENQASGKWKSLAGEIRKTVSQMEMMDSYQERLHNLLKENDVKALSDTEEILDQAEQYLCQNVRKLINYMNVFDENDVEVVKASVEKTNAKNDEQLAQVRDFIKAVTDFVNQQGTDAMDPDFLTSYKELILDTMREEPAASPFEQAVQRKS